MTDTDKNLAENLKQINENYQDLGKYVRDTLKNMSSSPSPTPPRDNNIRINFTNRRWPTFFTFIGCAFEILFSGKTTLVIKKR